MTTHPRRQPPRTPRMGRADTSTTPIWAGALAGLLATAAGLLVGSGAAALLTGAPSPVTTVGNRAVDLAPPFLKDFAVRQFGTNDKVVLIGGVVVVVLVAAAVIGVVGRSRPRLALAAATVITLLAVLSAALDRTASATLVLAMLPSVLTLVVAVGSLALLLGLVRLGPRRGDDLPSGFNRRAFLQSALGVGVLAVVGGSVSRLFGGAAAAESRRAVRIPQAAQKAPTLSPAVQSPVKGVSSFITPNSDFYRIDTALQVPDVPAETWSLRVHGLVDEELTFDFRDLLDMPLVERRITMTCVSNEVGGPYVGTATWTGIPFHTILEQAGVTAGSGADAVKSTSADDMTIGTPLSALTDPDRGAMIVVAMNGEPLPLQHGFPVRMIVPGLYGYVSATKWLVDLEVTRFKDFKAYWTPRGYSEEAPIKTSSRIDVPRPFEALQASSARIGGVAWAQTKGIERVEVQIDNGPWNDVTLAEEDSVDTWRQWSWTWEDATPGSHSVTVRATDGTGYTQTSEKERIRPDGTTGWHRIQFTVE